MKVEEKSYKKILGATMAKDVQTTINILPMDIYDVSYMQNRSKNE